MTTKISLRATGILSIICTDEFLLSKEIYRQERGENNKPPIAVAGPDQIIALPAHSILLDGSASSDPDGMISEWLWKKTSGPASFNIVNAITVTTDVKNLSAGVYQFELTVKDNGGLPSKDPGKENSGLTF